jgi:surface antigen
MQLRSIVTALALLVAGSVFAAGLGFMSKGPMARFNAADMTLFNDALARAQAAPQPGTAIDWANEKTGSAGSVTPLRLFEDGGLPCRELKIVNRHQTMEESGVYTMCRQQDGRWMFRQ